jgi:uncharacterized protein (TIRG00374 family)
MKRIVISLAIGIAMLFLVIQTTNTIELSKKITTASPILVLISFTIIVCFSTIKAVRWKIIVGKGNFLNYFSIVQIGNLLANLLPAQLQEPIRAALLKNKENIGFGRGLSSIFIERLMDVVGLLVIGVIASLLFPITDNTQSGIFHLMKYIIIFLSVLIGFLVLLVFKPKLFSRIFSPLKKHQHFEKLYKKLEFLILELSDGFKEMGKRPLNMTGAFLITVLMWMINFASVYFLFLSIGFQIAPLVVLFGFVGSALGMAIPQSPGYVGTFEIIWLGAFSTLGYAHNSEILAVGILYHILIIVYGSILGIVGMVKLHVSVKDLFGYKKTS